MLASKKRKNNRFVIVEEWIIDLKLPPAEFLIYILLRYHLPNAFPTLNRLAKISGLQIRQIRRVLKRLEEKALIQRHLRAGYSSEYSFNEPEGGGHERPGSPVIEDLGVRSLMSGVVRSLKTP